LPQLSLSFSGLLRLTLLGRFTSWHTLRYGSAINTLIEDSLIHTALNRLRRLRLCNFTPLRTSLRTHKFLCLAHVPSVTQLSNASAPAPQAPQHVLPALELEPPLGFLPRDQYIRRRPWVARPPVPWYCAWASTLSHFCMLTLVLFLCYSLLLLLLLLLLL
jgi:hypothetical protein